MKATNSTARLLCPKKALNRTNLTKPNYSGSGRKGKPLKVGIKLLGRESAGKTAKVSAGIAACGTRSLVLGRGRAGLGELAPQPSLAPRIGSLSTGSRHQRRHLRVCFMNNTDALWCPTYCPARSRSGYVWG